MISRPAAQARGLMHYYLEPCRRGHEALRYVSNKACQECQNVSARQQWAKRKGANVAFFLCRFARKRAKDLGLPFDLTVADCRVPERRPVLGIPLTHGQGKAHGGSPTIDRIVPVLGYVKGNIAVISHRANMLKSNGSPDELMAVAVWVDAQYRARCKIAA